MMCLTLSLGLSLWVKPRVMLMQCFRQDFVFASSSLSCRDILRFLRHRIAFPTRTACTPRFIFVCCFSTPSQTDHCPWQEDFPMYPKITRGI